MSDCTNVHLGGPPHPILSKLKSPRISAWRDRATRLSPWPQPSGGTPRPDAHSVPSSPDSDQMLTLIHVALNVTVEETTPPHIPSCSQAAPDIQLF